jgi:hypothetical protein
MALNLNAIRMIAPALKGDVLSLGYPDLLITAGQCKETLGCTPTRFNKLARWHEIDFDPPETWHVFELLGANLTCVDYAQIRGGERIADLNLPQDLGEFDLVIDPGTTEHCFNVGQALLNAARAVKVGGYIFHTSPMTMVNHGFYNFSPTLFYDFYKQNEWLIKVFVVANKKGAGEFQKFHPVKDFNASVNCAIYFLALKTRKEINLPIQTKYLKSPNLGDNGSH